MTGIFIDLDGTLLNDSGKISKDDLAYLKSVKDKYNIYLTTGLPYMAAKMFYDEIGLNTYLISSGGQEISKGKNKQKNTFDKSELIKLVNQHDNIAVVGSNGFYSKGNISKHIRHGSQKIEDPSELEEIVGVYLLDQKVESDNFNSFGWDVGDGISLSILRPLGASKEDAMDFVINKDELDFTIMLGNGRADINSIVKANVGVAMSNSYPDVLDKADILSLANNNNSGVSKTLKQIFK